METETAGKELLTRAEVCEVLAIGPTKLWELTSSSRLSVVRIGPLVRIRRQDLDDFIAKNRFPAGFGA